MKGKTSELVGWLLGWLLAAGIPRDSFCPFTFIAVVPRQPIPGTPKAFEEVRQAAIERRIREERERVASAVVRSQPITVPQSPTDGECRADIVKWNYFTTTVGINIERLRVWW